ncbi:MAG TPA: 3-hydroxyacyl-CoA dehydrogenase NAD-binding domain-containing protein [Phycisphaerae bacterium]|jgi:3-hydroxybutyryl-CoA dehydrogenase
MRNIAVIGAGTMGAGIAQVAAAHGCNVYLLDVSREVLDRALTSIGEWLARAVAKGKLTAAERDATLARVIPTEQMRALSAVELAIEAVVERLDVKRQIFQALEAHTPGSAVFATNTSSLSVSKIADTVSDPTRVIGLHFFNPAPLMPLVEVIAGIKSDPEVLDSATQIVRSWGKVTVRAKDTPGFVVNRVARGFYLEALRMLGEGVADIQAIDASMRDLGGFKMGPFELMDLVGLDINYAVSTSVWEQLGRPPNLTPHPIQQQLVEQKRLGRKTGRGFYRYDTRTPAPDVQPEGSARPPPGAVMLAVQAFCARATERSAADAQKYIFARILATIMNEATLAFDEAVATADDIDIAMEQGANYPLGPLKWAQRIGRPAVVALLEALNAASADKRFTPAASLVAGR